jgi:hypothetical protein
LGKCSRTEDIEAVLRKIEYWHQGSIVTFFKIMYQERTGSGTEFDGTAKPPPVPLYGKPTSKKPAKKLFDEG